MELFIPCVVGIPHIKESKERRNSSGQVTMGNYHPEHSNRFRPSEKCVSGFRNRGRLCLLLRPIKTDEIRRFGL